MHRTIKCAMVILVITALVAFSGGIVAAGAPELDDPQVAAGAMAGDVLIARPLGIVTTVAGFGLFVISSPFSLLGGNVGDAWGTLVAHPAKFTFVRPLGDFD